MNYSASSSVFNTIPKSFFSNISLWRYFLFLKLSVNVHCYFVYLFEQWNKQLNKQQVHQQRQYFNFNKWLNNQTVIFYLEFENKHENYFVAIIFIIHKLENKRRNKKWNSIYSVFYSWVFKHSLFSEIIFLVQDLICQFVQFVKENKKK